MKSKSLKCFISAGITFLAFIVFTILVKFVDVQAVGPRNSLIGFATLNLAVLNACNLEGLLWYNLSEIIGYLAIIVAGVFAIKGLIQLIKRKSIKKVDKNLLILCGLYLLVVLFYMFFEVVVINYRPVLLVGKGLEASYPSSHTMLSLVVFISAIPLVNRYVQSKGFKIAINVIFIAFAVITPIARVVSEMHWFTDIVGSVLLSASLLTAYNAVIE